jgi:hypothetical protein
MLSLGLGALHEHQRALLKILEQMLEAIQFGTADGLKFHSDGAVPRPTYDGLVDLKRPT